MDDNNKNNIPTCIGEINSENNSRDLFRDRSINNLVNGDIRLPNIRTSEDSETIIAINNNPELRNEIISVLRSISSNEYNPISINLLLNNSNERIHIIINDILNSSTHMSILNSQNYIQIANIFTIGTTGITIMDFNSELVNYYIDRVSLPESIASNIDEINENNRELARNLIENRNIEANNELEDHVSSRSSFLIRNRRFIGITISGIVAAIAFSQLGHIDPLQVYGATNSVISNLPFNIGSNSAVTTITTIPTDEVTAQAVTTSFFTFIQTFLRFIRRQR